MKYDPVKLAAVVDRVDALAERIDYLAAERMDAPLITRRADDWNEGHHPRGPDGKFVEGAGAAGAAAKEYLAKQAKDGKKATPQGMMQHLLLNGGISKAEIWDTAKANFEMAPHLNNYVSAVLATMKKKGIDVAEPPKPGKGGAAPAAKAEKPKAEDKPAPKDDPGAEGAPVEPAAKPGAQSGGAIPEHDDSSTQKFMHGIANDPAMSTADKVAELKKEIAQLKAEPNKEYGNKLLKALGAEPANLGPPAPDASQTQQYFHQIYTDPDISDEAKLAQLSSEYHQAGKEKDKKYALALTNALHASAGKKAKAPAAAPPVPPLPEPKTSTQDDIHYVATSASLSPLQKLTDIKNLKGLGSDDDEYKHQAIEHLKGKHPELAGGAKAPAPAAATPLPKPPPKPLAQTKALTTELDDLKTKWKGMTAQNKPPVDAMAQQLDKALSMSTGDEQSQALGQITPIPNPMGLGQQSANEFLAKAQKAAGLTPAVAGTPVTMPATSSLPKGAGKKLQSEIFHALHDSPAVYMESVSKFDGAGGKIKARNVIDTDKIPKDQYAKITAAYGADRENAMTQAVDHAMGEYENHSFHALPQETKDAVSYYQGSGYDPINQTLLAGEQGGPKVKAAIAKIKNAISKSVIPADTPVFRGMRCSLKSLSGFDDPAKSVGRAFVHKNFASVSRSRQTSKQFGDQVTLKMTLPAGTQGLVMKGQANYEREIMLNANSIFRIDKVEQIADSSGHSAKHLVHVTYMGTKEDA